MWSTTVAGAPRPGSYVGIGHLDWKGSGTEDRQAKTETEIDKLKLKAKHRWL